MFPEEAARHAGTCKCMDVAGRVLGLVLGWSLRTGAEAEAGKRFLPGKGRALNAVLGCLDFYPSARSNPGVGWDVIELCFTSENKDGSRVWGAGDELGTVTWGEEPGQWPREWRGVLGGKKLGNVSGALWVGGKGRGKRNQDFLLG